MLSFSNYLVLDGEGLWIIDYSWLAIYFEFSKSIAFILNLDVFVDINSDSSISRI